MLDRSHAVWSLCQKTCPILGATESFCEWLLLRFQHRWFRWERLALTFLSQSQSQQLLETFPRQEQGLIAVECHHESVAIACRQGTRPVSNAVDFHRQHDRSPSVFTGDYLGPREPDCFSFENVEFVRARPKPNAKNSIEASSCWRTCARPYSRLAHDGENRPAEADRNWPSSGKQARTFRAIPSQNGSSSARRS